MSWHHVRSKRCWNCPILTTRLWQMIFRADYTFMRDHAAAMSIVPGDRMDCLLITTEARNQGILMSQFRGNRYIKYIADLPKLGLDLAGVPVCREALVKLPRQPKKAKRLGKNQER